MFDWKDTSHAGRRRREEKHDVYSWNSGLHCQSFSNRSLDLTRSQRFYFVTFPAFFVSSCIETKKQRGRKNMDQGDHELLSLLAIDLDGHFRQLVEVYQQRLYLFALRLAGRPDHAEDTAHEAFLHAYYYIKVTPTRTISILNLRKW